MADEILTDEPADDEEIPVAETADAAPAPDTKKVASKIPGRGADFIRALREERAVLQQRGLTDRVKQVDEQLRVHGAGPKASKAPADAATAGPKRTTANSKPRTTRASRRA